MPDTSTKSLFLQVDASVELLRRNLEAGEAPLNKFEQRAARMASNVDASISRMGSRFGPFAQLAEAAATKAQKSFESSFSQIQKLAATAIQAPTIKGGGLNLGAAEARQGAEIARQQALALGLIEQAAHRAAAGEGELTTETRLYLQAASAARIEAELRAKDLAGEAGALERLEIETRAAGAGVELFNAQQRSGAVVSGQSRAAMQQLSFQLNDVAVGFAAGTPPAIIFAQQGGQVAQAIGLMTTKTTGLLGFLGGPWGIAFTSALVVLSPFVAKLFESNDALGDAVDKLHQDAAETALADRAHVAFTNTIEGQIDAQQRLNHEIQQGITSQRQANQQHVATAQANVSAAQMEQRAANDALNIAKETQRQVTARQNDPTLLPGQAGALAKLAETSSADKEVAFQQARVKSANTLLSRAQQGVLLANIPIAIDNATAAADPIAGINKKYDDMHDAAVRAAQGNDKLNASLTATLTKIELNRKTATTTEQARQSFARGAPGRAKADARHTEAVRQKDLSDDIGYTEEERQARHALLDATRKTAASEAERDALIREDINATAAAATKKIDLEQGKGELKEAEANHLKSIIETTRVQKLQNVDLDRARATVAAGYDQQSHSLETTIAMLRIQQDMATTLAERRRIALLILAAEQEQERIALEKVRDTSDDPAAVQQAITDLKGRPALEAGQRAQVVQQNAGPLDSYRQQLNQNVGDMNTALQGVEVDGLKGLEDGLTGIITGTESVGSAFKKMASSIIADLARIAIEKAVLGAITGGGGGGFLSGLFHADGGIIRRAGGGDVRGPGGPRDDRIPALLSNGEFVINAASTARYRGAIEAINSNRFPRFADGGPVTPSAIFAPRMPNLAGMSEPDWSGSRAPPGSVPGTCRLRRPDLGKAFTKVLIGAAIVGAAFLTGGASLVPSLSFTAAGSAVAVGGYLATTSLGALALGLGGSLALSGVMAPKTPKASLSQLDRLNASINPSAPRKLVLGSTAMSADIRYVEPSGENQKTLDYIIAVAAHRVTSIDELWIEDNKAWSATSGVTSKYVSYLTVDTRLEGSASNTIAINGGGRWGGSRRLTGCAYIHLTLDRTDNKHHPASPFSSGLPSRMTIVGKGLPLYDPRRDSTVGGSGAMRADDQSTWAFTDGSTELGENSALQILAYLLGWKISGKLSVGAGLPKSRLDMASFIEAANLCDEPVTLAAGGTEPRYRSAGVTSEADDPSTALGVLLSACNGRLRDGAGKLSLAIMHNDLAAAASDAGLNDDDVLSGFAWDPDPKLDQSYNIICGKFTDPSITALYQPNDYPEIELASVDGIDRILTLDLLAVESASRAQRLAKQALQRKQYQRSFSATFGATAWRYTVGDIVPLTFSALGFNRRLFRVEQQTPTLDGTCPMVLTEENAAIYAWDSEDSPAVQAAEPVVYDPLNNPLIVGIDQAGTTADWSGVVDDNGNKPEDNATDGATVGTNLKGPDGLPLFPSEVLNQAIDLSPSGELTAPGRLSPLDPITRLPLGKIKLPDLGAASDTARRQLDDAADTLGLALAQLAIDHSHVRKTLTDAGIYTDPATGEVRLYAVDQAADRVSNVEVRLSGTESTIKLKASTTYVDNAIATAVLDPSQVPVFGTLEARITSAEVNIDGVGAAVTLKADATTVGTLAARLTSVEAEYDALTGTISLKADSTTVTAIDSRVTAAETTISALGDGSSIVQSVAAARYAQTAADSAGEATLRGILANYDSSTMQIAQLATASDQLTARIIDGDTAEAKQRLALAAQVGTAQAAIASEATARVDGDNALATLITTLQSAAAGNSAAITTESSARVSTPLRAFSPSIELLCAVIVDVCPATVVPSVVTLPAIVLSALARAVASVEIEATAAAMPAL